ncbi:hypothetical protein, partial [Caballeronia sp. GACF4]|uniref:hypothetical protein n=1 Tax=Caballeronia sp. GACF4 TaxID=2921763 RepID=UPI0020281AE0
MDKLVRGSVPSEYAKNAFDSAHSMEGGVEPISRERHAAMRPPHAFQNRIAITRPRCVDARLHRSGPGGRADRP